MNKKDFLERMRKKFKKYDYVFILPKKEKIKPEDEITVICKKHGKYIKTAQTLLKNSKGYKLNGICNKCWKESKKYKKANKEIREKIEKTTLERYGVKNPSQSEIVKEKKKQKALEKYGCENVFQSEEIKTKIKENNIKNYGVEHNSQRKDVKEHIVEANIKKYGVNCVFKSEKIKKKIVKTNIKKYGAKSAVQSEKIKEKIKQTNLKKYGVDCVFKNEKIKQKIEKTNKEKYGYKNGYKDIVKKREKTCKEKYGVKYYTQTEKYKKDTAAIKRQNNSFKTSKDEENFYIWLLNKYEKKDIYRNYNEDERYPYMCDFYIKSKDLFIELNVHWTHGKHWFNKNNAADIKKIKKWQQKAKKSKFYKNAIEVWTKKDIQKRKTAKKNKLKYIVLWNKKDIETYKEKRK